MTTLGVVAVIVALFCAGCSQTAPGPGEQVVSVAPTPDTLQPRQPVLYDDGRCPEGQIARFVRRGAGSNMARTCVDRPA